MGLFVQAAAVAAGEETGRRGEVMVEVTVGRRVSEQRRGRGRCGLASCGAGLGVPRPRGCWPGWAEERGGAQERGPRPPGVAREEVAVRHRRKNGRKKKRKEEKKKEKKEEKKRN
jgi:hypothetical protein